MSANHAQDQHGENFVFNKCTAPGSIFALLIQLNLNMKKFEKKSTPLLHSHVMMYRARHTSICLSICPKVCLKVYLKWLDCTPAAESEAGNTTCHRPGEGARLLSSPNLFSFKTCMESIVMETPVFSFQEYLLICLRRNIGFVFSYYEVRCDM